MPGIPAVSLLFSYSMKFAAVLFQSNWHELKSLHSHILAVEEAVASQHHADSSLVGSSGWAPRLGTEVLSRGTLED